MSPVTAIDAIPGGISRTRRLSVDGEAAAGASILAVALGVGLATASHYGMTVDEFNTNDYGPKALAWYTSGFVDRSHFETVEAPLWYYGPWFQMLVAFVQALGLGDPLTMRHAMTFAVGLAGLAALLPIGRLAFGRWVGPAALMLSLTTGYLYGSLFFTPIDVPFLATMCWATLAILVMARHPVPTWPATLCAGLATGLAIATRTGGIITHAYLLGAMALCTLEALVLSGRAARPQVSAIVGRTCVVIVLAWATAIALWPWLQVGNPFAQFRTALVHFATIPMAFSFPHWGEQVATNAVPWSYVPTQWLARLPEAFLALLAIAAVLGAVKALWFVRTSLARFRQWGVEGLRGRALLLARARRSLVVWAAAIAPVGFLMIQQSSLYDGVRHSLFVIPMLALLAGWALVRMLPWLRRVLVPAAAVSAAYLVALIVNLGMLHPLEYVATNALAGGTQGSYGRFELDYWAAAATEALRRLEHRLDAAGAFNGDPPSLLICIRYREAHVAPMLRKNWRIELDISKADFVIETQRLRCAAEAGHLVLIDEVRRRDRTFAWTYVREVKGSEPDRW
jgi:hypothetical protein